MKKLLFAVAAAAMFVACQKNQNQFSQELNQNTDFSASMEKFDADTKTELYAGNNVVWSEGDAIAIFQGSTAADLYQLKESSAGSSNGSFSLVSDNSEVNGDFTSGMEIAANIALYPYSEGLVCSNAASDEEAYIIEGFRFPSYQEYAPNSFAQNSFAMTAITSSLADHKLNFRNVGGAIKFQFSGNATVKSIKLEGNNNEIISGAAEITVYPGTAAPAVSMANPIGKSITLDCGNGVALSTDKATEFIIALPPTVFANGFTVTVTDIAGAEAVIVADAANEVKRSSILKMPVTTVEISQEETPELIELYSFETANGDYVGTNSDYNKSCEINVEGITWVVEGNSTMSPWRVGGKNIDGVDRAVYTVTPFPKAIKCIDLRLGMCTLTLNSCKLLYSQNNDFSNAEEILLQLKTGNAKNYIPVDIPAGSYIKFVFNCTNAQTSNKYIHFNGVSFYGEAGGEEGGEDNPGGDNPGGDTNPFEKLLSTFNSMEIYTYENEDGGADYMAVVYAYDYDTETASDAYLCIGGQIVDKNHINGTHEFFIFDETYHLYLSEEEIYPFASGTVNFSCLQQGTEDYYYGFYVAVLEYTFADGKPYSFTFDALETLAIDIDLSDFETDEYAYYILQDEPVATKANALSYYPSIKTRPMPRKSPAFEHVMLRR